MLNKRKNKHRLVLSLIITAIFLFSYLKPTAVSAEIVEGSERIFLKIEDEGIKNGNIGSAPAYTQVLEYDGKIGINYRFFYPVNGPLGGSAGYHEGDWEGVKVIIDKETEEIIQIRPSAHESETGWLNPSEFSFTNGRFNLYSAKYSHANYPTVGTHSRYFEGIDFLLPDDHTNKGPLWDIKNKIVLLSKSDTSEAPWMDFNGYWGATGSEITIPFDPGAIIGTESPKFGLGKGWFRDETGASSSSQLTDLVIENNDLAMYYAMQFAPNVYLHDEDPYGPSSVEAFLAASSLNKYYLSTYKWTGDIFEITEELIPHGSVNMWSLVGKDTPPVYPVEIKNITNDSNRMQIDWEFIQHLGSADTLTLKREKLYPDGTWKYTNYDVTGQVDWENESDWDTDYRVKLIIKNGDNKVLYETPWKHYTMPPPPAPKNVTSRLLGDETSGFGIQLRWDDVPLALQSHQFGINGYVIYRDGEEIGRVASDQTSFDDFDVVQEHTYKYEVKSEGVNENLSTDVTSITAGIYFIDNVWLTSSSRTDNGVFLYRFTDYQGEYIELEPGEYPSLANISLGDVTADNRLSSLVINSGSYEGYRVTVYEEEDFKGASYSFNVDDNSFKDENLNDKISSIKVEVRQDLTTPTVSLVKKDTGSVTLNIDSPNYNDLTLVRYHIERDGKSIGSVNINDNQSSVQFVDDTVEPGKQYSYTAVTAYTYVVNENSAGFEYSNDSKALKLSTYERVQNLLNQNSINDFKHSSWKKNGVSVGNSSVLAPDGSLAQKLTPATVNSEISQYDIDINQEGNKYVFGVWLKADVPHQAQIKIQNTSNVESTGVKVDVTSDWQYFTVTSENAFTTDDGLTVVIWPGAYNGTTDSVYAWEPELIEE
ncbi:Vps62-related protein [Bacillus spongiae]|uniref:Vps62-related protein n=1 Tax=Bacillus spongiae TaxID=2683610 RepID=A0ABU8HIW0_9BACI